MFSLDSIDTILKPQLMHPPGRWSFAKSKSPWHSVALFVLMLAASVSQTSSVSAEDEWRWRGRQAAVNLYERNFSDAANGYLSALEVLPNDQDHADARLDLRLALAETYRRSKDFTSSETTLKTVKLELDAHRYSDPLLPARYWRRRRDLMESLGERAAAIEASIKVNNIVEQHFGTASENFVQAFKELIDKLISGRDWQQLLEYMKGLLAKLPQADADGQVEKKYELALSQVRTEVFRLIKLKKLALAKRLLTELQQVELHTEKLPEFWQIWLFSCHEAKETNLIEGVDSTLTDLSRSLQRTSSSVASLRAAATCH
ncbi:MAG: hypothetical protein K2Z81_11725, partial [Cyanobacteria bacterium]|nr:hypothetical protein [Cyanobacteriota bacterium]